MMIEKACMYSDNTQLYTPRFLGVPIAGIH